MINHLRWLQRLLEWDYLKPETLERGSQLRSDWVQANQSLQISMSLQFQNSFYCVICDEKSGDSRMLQTISQILNSQSVIKWDNGQSIEHASDVSDKPFISVLGEDTNKFHVVNVLRVFESVSNNEGAKFLSHVINLSIGELGQFTVVDVLAILLHCGDLDLAQEIFPIVLLET